MTVEGGFVQAGSYSAEVLRRATTGILLERGASIGSVVGGLVAATDLQTKAGTGMHVETSPGECVVNQGYSTSGGPNYIRLTSTLTSNVPAASPSLPRVDLLCAQVDDAAYHGSLNEYAISYLEGTPTSGATLANKSGAPTLPTSALALAYILVPANATSLANEDIENVGKVLLLGHGVTKESITGPMLSNNTVTGDKLAVNKNHFTTMTERTLGIEYECSPTKLTYVKAVLTGLQKNANVEAHVGGVLVPFGSINTNASELVQYSTGDFFVPAGAKWKIQLNSGSSPLYTNYLEF